MLEVLSLFKDLHDDDIHWILQSGQEQQVISGTVIIQEGKQPEALWFVLEGLVSVSTSLAGPGPLALLGPGELLGEISFLEDSPATATVTAAENTLLLCLPRARLTAQLDEDPWFAQRLYRAFALISSRRLRERVQGLVRERQAHAAVEETPGLGSRLGAALFHFKSRLQTADQAAIRDDGTIGEELREAILSDFQNFTKLLNDELGDASGLDRHVREDMGVRVKTELLPYILLTQSGERFYSKPRGYAGDFMTIEFMYQNTPTGTGRIGPLLDEGFLELPASQAVRNRRGLLVEEIQRTCETSTADTVRVTSLACGPAAEVFDVLSSSKQASRLKVTLLDIDLQALAFVTDKAAKRKLQRQIKAVNGNLVYLATGRQQLDLPPQDLVYSIGLIDYFSDKFVLALLDYVYGLLQPGGRVILGNYHPTNTTKALMDYVLDWKLIHRSEADMHRLFRQSRFQRPCTQIRFEAQGINLFAEGIKEAS